MICRKFHALVIKRTIMYRCCCTTRAVVRSVPRAGQGAASRPRLGGTKGWTKGGAKGWTRGGDKGLVQGRRQGPAPRPGRLVCMSVRCLCVHEIVCACIMLSVHVSCFLCVCEVVCG